MAKKLVSKIAAVCGALGMVGASGVRSAALGPGDLIAVGLLVNEGKNHCDRNTAMVKFIDGLKKFEPAGLRLGEDDTRSANYIVSLYNFIVKELKNNPWLLVTVRNGRMAASAELDKGKIAKLALRKKYEEVKKNVENGDFKKELKEGWEQDVMGRSLAKFTKEDDNMCWGLAVDYLVNPGPTEKRLREFAESENWYKTIRVGGTILVVDVTGHVMGWILDKAF